MRGKAGSRGTDSLDVGGNQCTATVDVELTHPSGRTTVKARCVQNRRHEAAHLAQHPQTLALIWFPPLKKKATR